MTLKLPRIIGHRGAMGYAPENTIESVQTAAEMGVQWVELDVKLTKDDIPIIFHDETLERTTNGSGLVAQTLYEDIANLEAGSWFGDSFAGIKIPTLEEMCEALIHLDLGLNLEIKPCPGREKETAEVALDHLSRIWDNHDNLLISSFSHVSLETAMEMAADWRRGLLIDEWPENWKDLADYLQVSVLNINGNECTREQVEAIIDMDYPILAYTINDPQRARILQSWGVDGVFTDVPDIIQESLLTIH
ncbi:MAG: glycerophosphoryl diester phosphodiesterase [Alphaproteobacteria bacterium CG_4_9_14_3_um_filter_47_13]|nr:MAG: glycerophosphoryl diester phosphodiesterase [Alphaproteobacteria bacterium CG_4_9_14_3_um_filter_47_13]